MAFFTGTLIGARGAARDLLLLTSDYAELRDRYKELVEENPQAYEVILWVDSVRGNRKRFHVRKPSAPAR